MGIQNSEFNFDSDHYPTKVVKFNPTSDHKTNVQESLSSSISGPKSREVSISGAKSRQVKALMASGRWESAFVLNCRMRKQDPSNSNLAKEMHVIKDHLMGKSLKQLGDLNRVPYVTRKLHRKEGVSIHESDLLQQVDGKSTLSDIIQATKLSEFVAYRSLVLLINRKKIGFSIPSESKKEARHNKDNLFTTQPINPFDEFFNDAMEAYIRRDFNQAIDLFRLCLEINPNDKRSKANLKRLNQRKVKK